MPESFNMVDILVSQIHTAVIAELTVDDKNFSVATVIVVC